MPSSLPPTFISGFHDEALISELKYKQLGQTDMIVSELTFGGSAVGSVFRVTDDEESKNVVTTALKYGLNMIDTAPWYGQGKSERVLGKETIVCLLQHQGPVFLKMLLGGNLVKLCMNVGGTAIGSIYRKTENEESLKVVEKALKYGINMIDTAPWYGQGKSESIVGKILQNVPRKAYYLNTKVGRYELEPTKMFDFSAERVIRSVDESLQRLGVEYVDVIQVHDMEFAPNLDVIINETLPALQKVKESGKARYIGITGYPMENFRTVIEKSPVKVDTILTYCHGSMNDNSLVDYLPFLQSKGIGVINASILSMGLLTNRGPASWHPAGEKIRRECKKGAEFCQERDVDISKIATHYSLQLDGVDTTLIGTASLKNLDTSVNVLKEGITAREQQVSDEVMEKIFNPLGNATWEGVEVEKYWNKMKKLDTSSLVLG